MKVFVTGVGGQLGHDVMNELNKRGYEGVGTDIAPQYSGVQDGSAVCTMPYIPLDITDASAVEAVITQADPDVVIQIRDYGSGIPEDELPLVKRKFYKGSSKARGTGIGLAVCDEIVQMHNGELTLENAEGGGTMVTIRLPISQ